MSENKSFEHEKADNKTEQEIIKNDKKKKNDKAKKEKKASSVRKSFMTKAFRAGGYSTAASAAVIIIAVIINMLVSGISSAYTNIDTTEAGLYSVSDETRERLSKLENEVTVYYVASPESKAGYVTKLLDKFASCSVNLKAKDINPDTEPDFASKYTEETVSNGDLLVVCGDKSQVIHYDDMIEYEAGSYEYYYYYMQNGQQTDIYWNGEILLLKAVDYVTASETYNAYFLDIGGDGDFSALEKSLDNENIICGTLTDDIKEIPSDADCVIIPDLNEDISESVYTLLDNYLNKGGKLYLAFDFTDEEHKHLDKLLSEYGLSFTAATLEDGDKNYDDKSMLYPQYTGEHAIISPFSKANYICFPNSVGIEIKETEGVAVTPLLTTSESAYLSTDDADDLQFALFNLGVLAEKTDTGAQIAVYGSADYTDSEYMSDSRYSNSDLFVNSVGYLCDKDNAVAIHAKSITSDTALKFSKGATGYLVAVIAVLPALICITAGFVIWYRRKNR